MFEYHNGSKKLILKVMFFHSPFSIYATGRQPLIILDNKTALITFRDNNWPPLLTMIDLR